MIKSNIFSGLTVGIIALPLSMALAIATGVPPQLGLYTAIVAGILAAIFGSSKVNISGPTAAFIVIFNPYSSTIWNNRATFVRVFIWYYFSFSWTF